MNRKYSGYPRWYQTIQCESEKREEEAGWPDPRQEAWRRTDLKRLNLDALYAGKPEGPLPESQGARTLHSPSADNQNMSLFKLSEAVRGDFPGVQELYEAQFAAGDNRFVYRLLAEVPRGLYFYFPRNYHPEELIFLEDMMLSSPGGESTTLNLIVLEEGAQVDLWERIGMNPSGLHNRATLILLNERASLHYYRTQSLSIESGLVDFSRILLKEGARFNGCQAESEIRFNKSHLTAELRGKGAHAELRGIYRIGGDRFCEIFTEQDHLAPGCTSRSFYKGVLSGKARTVFNGMIKVDQDAVKTDAYLTNNNLLMNDGCRADSIPGLKIGTNDVKCSHGSTTGKIDPRQMFYLQSRGFLPEEAKEILTHAFLEEVLPDLPSLVREELISHWNWAEDGLHV